MSSISATITPEPTEIHMNTYTLKQLEQAVFGAAPQLLLHSPFQLDVPPEDSFVVEEEPDSSVRWIIVLDVFSGLAVKVLSDDSGLDGDRQ
jgi:hypothetical protein